MQYLPLTNAPRQALSTLLGGQRVALRVEWNPTARAWFLTLDHGETRVATGRQIAPWTRLLRVPTAMFDGDLIVLAASGNDYADLGRRAWVETHSLWHLTADELTAARL